MAALVAGASARVEIRVLSAAAVEVPAEATASAFARDTGHHVVFEFATAGQVDARLQNGASPDIVITTRERASTLIAGALAGRQSPRALGTVGMGVAVRRGAARPDLSTVESFTGALRRAASLTYPDPAAGATTGMRFAGVLDTLGLTSELRPKTVLAANGLDAIRRVAAGQVELGVTQISEILSVDPSTLAGPLPQAVQVETTYVAILWNDSNQAATAFLERLVDTSGRDRFRAAGFN